jgi:phospholipid/cholesterol/gamma-HCH transport system substrate-binding protein
MEKNANYFIVGLFVTAMLISLVGFTLWLAGKHGKEEGDFYTVFFTTPIGGLAEGTAVSYRGMPVGKVLDIRLDPEKSDLIKVDIEVKKITPVRRHTKAALAVQGITGVVHLDLSTSPDDRGSPEQVAGERYPVLRGEPSQISRILDGFSRLTSEGSAAAASVKNLASQISQNPSQLVFGKKDKKKRAWRRSDNTGTPDRQRR